MPSAAPRASSRQTTHTLSAENTALASQLAFTQTELQESNRRLRKYKVAMVSRNGAMVKIPRPEGERSKNGWNLQGAMGLQDDKERYCTIMRGCRTLLDKAGLDTTLNFGEQDPGRVYQYYRACKAQFPFLDGFQGDWVAKEFAKQALTDRRKYIARCNKDPRSPSPIEDRHDHPDKDDEDDDSSSNAVIDKATSNHAGDTTEEELVDGQHHPNTSASITDDLEDVFDIDDGYNNIAVQPNAHTKVTKNKSKSAIAKPAAKAKPAPRPKATKGTAGKTKAALTKDEIDAFFNATMASGSAAAPAPVSKKRKAPPAPSSRTTRKRVALAGTSDSQAA